MRFQANEATTNTYVAATTPSATNECGCMPPIACVIQNTLCETTALRERVRDEWRAYVYIFRNTRFGSEHDRLWESGSCESLLQRIDGGVRLHNEGWLLDVAALTDTAGFAVAYSACCSAVI